MEAPLLDRSSGEAELIGDDGDYVPAKGLKSWWRIFCIETRKLWWIGGPIAFQVLCQMGTYSVATIFAGRLGDVQLSAFSIALSVVGQFAYGFLLGMGSALETLCGQAYGAGQVHMLGVYMQRSTIILFVTCILLTPLYVFATPILKLLGQSDEIANTAGHITTLIIPQLFSLSVVFPAQKFLQAQSKVLVLALVSALALICQVVTCWVFVNVLGWGMVGAALAFDVTSWIYAIAQVVYVIGWCKEGWRGFSWLAFRDLWEFVKLSLASAVMLCLEVWYMMSILVLTGNLNDSVLAIGSLSICMNINGWENTIFIGINAAISVRVSNELGMGRSRGTKYSVYVTLLQSLLIGIVCMIIVLLARDQLSLIFSETEEMRWAVARLSGLLAINMLLNSIQPVISGVAIGGGWQALVAYINLGCYYIFGLPLGYVLGYIANLGVEGIWGGMLAGIGLQTLLLMVVVYKTNWQREVEQTTERMRRWGGKDITAEELPSN